MTASCFIQKSLFPSLYDAAFEVAVVLECTLGRRVFYDPELHIIQTHICFDNAANGIVAGENADYYYFTIHSESSGVCEAFCNLPATIPCRLEIANGNGQPEIKEGNTIGELLDVVVYENPTMTEQEKIWYDILKKEIHNTIPEDLPKILNVFDKWDTDFMAETNIMKRPYYIQRNMNVTLYMLWLFLFKHCYDISDTSLFVEYKSVLEAHNCTLCYEGLERALHYKPAKFHYRLYLKDSSIIKSLRVKMQIELILGRPITYSVQEANECVQQQFFLLLDGRTFLTAYKTTNSYYLGGAVTVYGKKPSLDNYYQYNILLQLHKLIPSTLKVWDDTVMIEESISTTDDCSVLPSADAEDIRNKLITSLGSGKHDPTWHKGLKDLIVSYDTRIMKLPIESKKKYAEANMHMYYFIYWCYFKKAQNFNEFWANKESLLKNYKEHCARQGISKLAEGIDTLFTIF